MALAISAAGVWLTEDGGATWRQGNRGIVADYLPEQAQGNSVALCVHGLERAPGRPERMFMQFHGGVYRSDDAGESWTDIADGLPSDFGFPVVVDPADPDSAYVIPVATADRLTPDGRVLVWETRDAGASWQPHGEGCRSTVRGCPCCARRLTASVTDRSSSCTSVRPRARSSAPLTPARAGFRLRVGCRRSPRSEPLAEPPAVRERRTGSTPSK